jgi:poly(A) polymerase
MITPTYMNSTLAVSRQTLQIMHEEFCRGHEIMDRLWKKEHQQHQKAQTKDVSSLLQWDELF